MWCWAIWVVPWLWGWIIGFVTIGVEPPWVSDRPLDILLHFCVGGWSLPFSLFLLFSSFCVSRTLSIFVSLPSISFSFFFRWYMLAAVVSIPAFVRILTHSSLSSSSAAIVAHVANVLAPTGKIPLSRHFRLQVWWWHSIS